jgi:hypothetical protein
VAYNRAAWDREVENRNEWTQPVGPEVIARARAGDWSVVLIGYQPVPRGWFPAEPADLSVINANGHKRRKTDIECRVLSGIPVEFNDPSAYRDLRGDEAER